ncbi:MFS transporter [Shewanella avicenniae]|uniref:MFS transporter n=1 Tax=Shewanella avicenniae TaxID=2814294 RepID=A0ABX7QL89_9GAMM|nr:MFS transporter [Shewanella avicenniae]QSX32219.1 MFS transporter [Shewanella avicenniae]
MHDSIHSAQQPQTRSTRATWTAIISLMLGVAALISAELLPVSLLTDMAQELAISTGMAGQMISTTATLAMLSGLILPSLFKSQDRRHLILSFTSLLVVSSILTSVASNIWLLLSARVLLGVAIGGFWAILTPLTMQLVPAEKVASAFSIIFSGVSLALVVAAPLGSYLGDIYGWRAVFVAVALMSLLVLLLQWFAVPSVHSNEQKHSGGMLKLLKRHGVAIAFFAMLLSFTGNQMLYIYMRPYMEQYLSFNIEQISLSWVCFGVASFMGVTFAGVLVQRFLKQILLGMPLAMVIVALAMLMGPKLHLLAFVLIAAWGFFGAVLPIIWSTWITRALPDAADSAGGLYSAALQIAAIIGASLSGGAIDLFGISANMWLTALIMLLTIVLTLGSLLRLPLEQPSAAASSRAA